MRILIVHQYFKTPEEGSGIRSWHLAHAFEDAGHQVTILSGHNRITGNHTIQGLNVNYFKVQYSNYQGFVKRSIAFLQFVIAAKKYLAIDHNYDLLYVLSTPLTTGLIALHGRRKYGINYLFEVGDLWPLAPIQMGVIKNSWIQKKLYQFEARVYGEASLLVGLSPAIKQAMEYTIDYSKKVEVLPNMSDCSFFHPTENIPEKFTTESPLVVGYQGAIGQANHLEFLIALAKTLEEEQLPVAIRIMGDGARKKDIQQLGRPLSTITWVESGGKNDVYEELSKSHISYISYAPFPVLETGSPNKLFDGLAAGKLILLNFKGWMSDLIREHECGFTYNPEEPEEIIETIRSLILSPTLLQAYQQNARKLAETKFSKRLITQEAINIVEGKSPN